MKERVRPDDIVDLDETEPAKKAKDLLEKAPYKQLTLLHPWKCRTDSV